MKYFSIPFWVLFISSHICQLLFIQPKLGTFDTLKTIIVYSINNKTNEIIAKTELKITVRNNTFIYAKAKLLENNLDKLTSVNKLELAIENNIVILTVLIKDDVGCTILLGLNKEGSIRSLSSNSSSDEADLRFGGVFSDQSKGVFKTENIVLKRNN